MLHLLPIFQYREGYDNEQYVCSQESIVGVLLGIDPSMLCTI